MKGTQVKKEAVPQVGQKKISSFFTPRPAKVANASGAGATPTPAADDQEKENKRGSRSPSAKAGAPNSALAKAAPAVGVRSSPRKQSSAVPDLKGSANNAGGAGSGSGTPSSAGAELIGRRVRVHWPDDKKWYSGAVTEWDGSSKHRVEYDDGDDEWMVLAKEQFEFLSAAAPAAAAGSPAVRKPRSGAADGKAAAVAAVAGAARKRRAVLDSDEEDGGGTAGKAKGGRLARRRGASKELDDSGSEFDAAEEAGASSSGGTDLEDELEDEEEEEEEGSDGGAAAAATAGAKRKRAPKAAAAKKPSGGAPTSAAAKTPAKPKSTGGGAASTPFTGKPSVGRDSVRSVSRTPQPGASEGLRRALDVTPTASTVRADSATPGSVVYGVETPVGGESERFQGAMKSRMPFLAPENIKDASRRRPEDPLYDPATLYVPEEWFKANKVAEGQKQWWGFKAKHFDSVLLFKCGKFYEMFEMDAFVGSEVLGLIFMKGDRPHAGFPEVRYHDMAEKLARAGHKVVVVEQVETPEGLKIRNEERRRKGLKNDGVVMREKVAVVTKGTLIDAEMVISTPDAAYVMAVFEMACSAAEEEAAPMDVTMADPASDAAAAPAVAAAAVVTIGLCVADVASGQLLVGVFDDDEVRSSLRTHLTSLQPVELVLPCEALSATTTRVLQTCLRDPRRNMLRGAAGDWSSAKALQQLEDGAYFAAKEEGEAEDAAAAAGAAGGKWPEVLTRLRSAGSSGEAALAALGGMVTFLKGAMLDRAVLPLGRFEALAEVQHGGGEDSPEQGAREEAGPRTMLLNGAALENLEILENGDGGTRGTLLAVLDHCTTPFGRRRLRQWLCRPLFRLADITARQDAVEALTSGPLLEAAGKARKHLAGVCDLERAVARLHASVSGGLGRDAAHVVLYEDAAKRRVNALLSAIKDLQAVTRAVGEFQEAGVASSGSALLAQLTDRKGRWALVAAEATALTNAANWHDAKETGRVVPAKGVDLVFDEACAAVAEVEEELQAHLKQVRQKLGGGASIKYVNVNKESYLIEVPEATKVPSSFSLRSQRSGFKRYSSPPVLELVTRLEETQDAQEAASSTILQGIVGRFVGHQALWLWAVECVAQLDALLSLSAHALNADGVMCRPRFVVPEAGGGGIFEAVGMRNPSGLPGRDGSFVPNDITLGQGAGAAGEGRPFLMLTGPNMGGKSTLLRQVSLAAVLAQVGACVPAESLTLSAQDAVFVRMGARDHILTGQSTFFVELFETGAMLNRATRRSLVVLDELGRGTATLDGAAIAAAVLHHLASTVRCLGLFATHYHHLANQCENDPTVAIMHMGCALEVNEEEEQGGVKAGGSAGGAVSAADADSIEFARVQAVTFLYKLTAGACPRSYGTNVARLAGLPTEVVQRAAHIAAAREATSHVGRDAARDANVPSGPLPGCGSDGTAAAPSSPPLPQAVADHTVQLDGSRPTSTSQEDPMDVDAAVGATFVDGVSSAAAQAALRVALAAMTDALRALALCGSIAGSGLEVLLQLQQQMLLALAAA